MITLENAYALIIGVGNDLPKTVTDATDIRDVLSDEKLSGYKPENIILLTEKEATRDGILKGFDRLTKMINQDSSVMLFYSGHGGYYEPWNQFFLVPNDYDKTNYDTTWIKAEELQNEIKKINSRKLIFFLDCCHAAGMTKSAPEIGDSESEKSLNRADGLAQTIDDGKGMCIVSSCREDQKSYILEGDRNSLFTRCLIEVLKGEHQKHFEEPFVRIYDVCKYIFKMVPERKALQRPYANLQIYDDFILSYIPENLRTNLVVAEETEGVDKEQAVQKEVVTVFRESENATSVVLFVHGFYGEGPNTFGKIPEYLMEDPEMDGWDMFPIGYSEHVKPTMGKQIWASIDDIERIADYLSTSIKYRFGRYKRIAIISHSLGGLVTQRALVQLSQSDQERISHLLFFGTPSNGIESDSLSQLWKNRLADLAKDQPFITELRKAWRSTYKTDQHLKMKVVAATNDQYVTTDSCKSEFDQEHFVMVTGNHFNMVQPETKDNDSYNLIKDTLTDKQSFLSKFTTQEDVNITLGEYDAVINKYLPIANELDKRGVQQLVFALEGMNRSDEALELLKTNKLLLEDVQTHGLLGGRFKRKYLLSSIKKFGEEAIKYYKMSYDYSVENKIKKEIYFNAINLAFLSLVVHADDEEMTNYANVALEYAKKDVFDNLWKIATIAESNLYLGNLDTAKDYYAKASKMADIRQKLSIHTNAHMAYTTLMNSNQPDDPFTVFLSNHFLF